MTLGIAVFILGCLYFYFKEPKFRKAAHVSAAVFGILILLSCLVGGVWYLKSQHDEKVTAQARQTQVEACIAHSTTAGNDAARNEIKDACESDPSKPLVLDMSASQPVEQPATTKHVHLPKPKHGYAYSTCSRDMMSKEFEHGLITGHINNHELLRVLQVNEYNAEVRTMSREVGWIWHPSDCLTTRAVDFDENIPQSLDGYVFIPSQPTFFPQSK